jgi:hypothetical protein
MHDDIGWKPTTYSNEFYLSSSSAWSIGSIALRAAIFSSFSALHIQNSTPLNYKISITCTAFRTCEAKG